MSYQQVSESGEGIIQIGEHSYKADWHLNGLQRIIETNYLDGTTGRTKGTMAYVSVTIAFQEKPNIDDLPSLGEQTHLMIDAARKGDMWVIAYGGNDGRVTVELSNRPLG